MKWEAVAYDRLYFLLLTFLPFTLVQSLLAQNQSAPSPFGKYTENINGVTLELVRIPNGKFMMGNDRSPNPEEKPAHLVTLKSFYMGQFEVTRGQWNIVAKTLPKVTRDWGEVFIGTCGGANCEATSPAHFYPPEPPKSMLC